jgi:hypothetical protein
MFYPKGKLLPSLEKNILKYRAFEMMLVLFYSEDLKKIIIDTIQSNDKIHMYLGERVQERISPNTKRKFQVALDVFINDGILTCEEVDEIKRLIDYRNIIAHDLYKLTADVNREYYMKEVIYNYKVRKRLKFFIVNIPDRLSKKYIISVSLDSLMFKGAARTYEDELKRLDKKVRKQIAIREKENNQLQRELSIYDNKLLSYENSPYSLQNKFQNGRLTKNGINICYQLFEEGKSVLLVSYLMRISYQSALKRQRLWRLARKENNFSL